MATTGVRLRETEPDGTKREVTTYHLNQRMEVVRPENVTITKERKYGDPQFVPRGAVLESDMQVARSQDDILDDLAGPKRVTEPHSAKSHANGWLGVIAAMAVLTIIAAALMVVFVWTLTFNEAKNWVLGLGIAAGVFCILTLVGAGMTYRDIRRLKPIVEVRAQDNGNDEPLVVEDEMPAEGREQPEAAPEEQ